MKKLKNYKYSSVILILYFFTSLLCMATIGARFCFFYDWHLLDEILACFVIIVSLSSQWFLFMLLCKRNNTIIILTRIVVYFDGIVNLFWVLLIICFLFIDGFRDSQIQPLFQFSPGWATLEIIRSVAVIILRERQGTVLRRRT